MRMGHYGGSVMGNVWQVYLQGQFINKNIFKFCLVTAIVLLWPIGASAQTAFPPVFDLGTLDGSNGFVIQGKTAGEQVGRFATGVGDVNGDGVDDFALGRPGADKGEIFFGRTGGYPSLASLQNFGGTGKSSPQSGGIQTPPGPLAGDVTVFDGSGSSSDAGQRIKVVSDVNGDGQRDLAVTQPFGPGGSRIAIFYGAAAGAPGSMFPASTDLDTLSDSKGFSINLPTGTGGVELAASHSVQMLFISPRQTFGGSADPAAPVLFLTKSPFTPGSPPPAGVTDTSLYGTAGSPGGKITATGVKKENKFGFAVDVSEGTDSFTGNGKSAVAIGAPGDGFSSTSGAGRIYVIFDIDTALKAGGTLDVATLDGSNGFVFEGDATGDELGFDLEFIPDVNGDGIQDIIIGIPGEDEGGKTDSGMACVLYGHTGPFPSVLHPSDLDGSNGTCIGGFDDGDRAGESVCGIADIDGDGVNETCIGAPFDDPDDGAGGFLVDAGSVTVIDLASIPPVPFINSSATSTLPIFHIPGLAAGDELGSDCTSPGDINGDGAADMICGAPLAAGPAGSGQGKDYVVCGKTTIAHTLVAKDDDFVTDEDTGITGNVFADNGFGADMDSLGHSLTVTQASFGSVQGVGTPLTIILRDTTINNAGTVQVDADGAFTFTPSTDLDQLGPGDPPVVIGIDYTVDDNHGLQDSAHVTITINGVNDPPQGVPVIIAPFINGHLGIGATITVDTDFGLGTVFDPEGISHSTDSFEFFDSNGVLIQTNTTGVLDTAALPSSGRQQLVGKSVTAKYSYTDRGGTDESVTSASVGPFSNPQLTVFLDGPGSGKVTSTPPGLDCPTTCTAEFDFGTQVSLHVVADAGSKVAGSVPAPTMNSDRGAFIRFELTNPAPTTVVSSVLPAARSGQTPGAGPDNPEKAGAGGVSSPAAAGDPVTVFYTAINAGAGPAQSCSITIDSAAPVTLSYQPVDAQNVPTGTADQPFDMTAGEVKTFVLAFTPVSVSTGTEVFPNVVCDNASVDPIPGVNGVFLTISDTPVPDVLSIGATVSNDGIIHIDKAGGAGVMAASAINIGVGDNGTPADPANPAANTAVMTVSADTGGANLPLVLGVCALDAAGVCIASPAASINVNVADEPATMAVFVAATGTIALDPAVNRVFMRFTDADGVTRSVTSAAITAP